ncbi:MAG: signal peptidase I [Clostridia bacterium]|nr:signal peptidase I [Clostridia bacterium]
MKHLSIDCNDIEEKKNFNIQNIMEWIFCIIIAVALALIFRYFIGTPTIVKMTSMYPTLKEGDRLFLNRTIRISNKLPNRGDIITFEAPSKKTYTYNEIDQSNPIAKYENQPTTFLSKFVYHVLEIGKDSYIKRVIALPGEHVEIKEGNVYINEKILEENYIKNSINTEVNVGFDNFIVPDNCIFAMGDNRSGSQDCRNFGCIPIDKIEGKVLFRVWPFNKLGKIK